MEKKAISGRTWIIIGVVVVLLTVLGMVGFTIAQGGADQNESLLTLGQRYMDELDYEQAVVCFEGYLEIDPKSVEAYLGLAEAYAGLDEYEKALEVLASGYAATGDNSLQGLISQYEDRYFVEFGLGVVDADDESVIEEEFGLEDRDVNDDSVAEDEIPENEMLYEGYEMLYEEYDFEANVSSDGLDVDAKYLTVKVQDNRSATITISGIALQQYYLTDLPTSKKNSAEYWWGIKICEDQDAYNMSTVSWAFDPGAEVTKGIEEMQHSGWVYYDYSNSFPPIDDVEMSHTSESITWTFTIPEEYPLDFAKVNCYVVEVIDSSQKLYLTRTYTLVK